MTTQNATSVATVELSDLPTNIDKLGSGGEGTVYRLGVTSFSSRPCAFKKYKPQANVDEQHLEKLVKFITKLGEVAPERREWLLDRAAWPTHLVRDSGKLVGIIMPLIPDRFFRTFKLGTRTKKSSAELQFLLNDPIVLQNLGLRVTERQRYEFLIDFADLLRVLHGAQVRVGDISVKNLLFCHDAPGPHAYLIDCDSMSIGTSEGPDVQTPNWNVPDGEKPQTFESDSYKLGLLVLRMLAADQNTREADNLPANTPSAVRALTKRALAAAPAARPTPKEWLGPLKDAMENASTRVQEATASGIRVAHGKDESGHSLASKKITARTSAHSVPQVVTTNAAQPTPAAKAPVASATTEKTAASSGSKDKKDTLRNARTGISTVLCLILAIANFALENIGTGILLLICFFAGTAILMLRAADE